VGHLLAQAVAVWLGLPREERTLLMELLMQTAGFIAMAVVVLGFTWAALGRR
jgi:hypothetical protein